ncbi:MAG: ArsA family ATPase [Bdellovibrionia bacterium]
MPHVPDQKIILVTGKGGVGKSTVAAAIAHKLSKQSLRVLLVEMGESSFYQDFFGLNSVGQEPVPLDGSLHVARWSTESCLREYVLHYVRVEALYKMFFENRVMKTFVRAAPTVSEIALLGKLTSNQREVGPNLDYDRIVVDAYATGHFLALLRAPRGLSEAVRAGPLGEQTALIYNVLTNPNITSYKIVSLPESLPTAETKELFAQLQSEFKVKPEIICNKIWKIPISEADLQFVMNQNVQSVGTGIIGFAKYLDYIWKRQRRYMPMLSEVDPRMDQIPLLTEKRAPLELIAEMSASLGRI